MNAKTIQAVTSTLEALQSDEYIIRIIYPLDEENKQVPGKPPINKRLDPARLLKEVKFYQAKNTEGYNIYFRPVGYQYVLLDDLSRQVLTELAKLSPCLLIETSPGNYQAWLRLAEIPQEREQASRICKELAALLSADKGSAEPDHIGRLPGFTNRKPKHQRPDGLFPFVELKKWESRVSTFIPLGGDCGQTNPSRQESAHSPGIIPAVTAKNGVTSGINSRTDRDRSREDYNLCCMLINQGKSDEYIKSQLETLSQKAKERNQPLKYIENTIRNARIKMGR